MTWYTLHISVCIALSSVLFHRQYIFSGNCPMIKYISDETSNLGWGGEENNVWFLSQMNKTSQSYNNHTSLILSTQTQNNEWITTATNKWTITIDVWHIYDTNKPANENKNYWSLFHNILNCVLGYNILSTENVSLKNSVWHPIHDGIYRH